MLSCCCPATREEPALRARSTWHFEKQITPLQKDPKQRMGRPSIVNGILQSGILQSGILQSPATHFGARNGLIYWDPTVWDPKSGILQFPATEFGAGSVLMGIL